MTTIREIFDFSRAEIFALSLLILMILIGGGILFYENITQTLPPDLIIESISAKPVMSPAKNASADKGAVAGRDSSTTVKNKKQLLLDINTAPSDSLVLLPRIGRVLADRIVEYRKKVGHIDSIDQLVAVRGIGKKNLETFRKYLFVSK